MIRQTGRSVVAALTSLLLAGCSVVGPEGVQRNGNEVRGTGTVQWYDFEGGFYAIRGDDRVTYEPIDLPDEFAEDGLDVWFEAVIRDDLGSFRMAGPVVELEEIRRR